MFALTEIAAALRQSTVYLLQRRVYGITRAGERSSRFQAVALNPVPVGNETSSPNPMVAVICGSARDCPPLTDDPRQSDYRHDFYERRLSYGMIS